LRGVNFIHFCAMLNIKSTYVSFFMNFYQIFMKFTADRVSLNDFSHSDSLSRGGIFFCCKAECHSFQEMCVSACAQTVCRRCSTKKIIFIKTKQKFWCSFWNFLKKKLVKIFFLLFVLNQHTLTKLWCKIMFT
jgi:hypothetical protein